MAQCDNNVIITGRVVKGPFVSYVNGDETKMRVKYQVSVFRRKRDTTQSFAPWVRTLGNQAKKDYDNIKVGDVVTVQGRIATRNETKKRYFILEDEALEIANASNFGLCGCIFTKDMKKAFKFANGLECGGVVINGASFHRSFEMPFGGYKFSGIGTEGVMSTFDQVTKTKTITFKNILK